jgi:hypothetical protein
VRVRRGRRLAGLDVGARHRTGAHVVNPSELAQVLEVPRERSRERLDLAGLAGHARHLPRTAVEFEGRGRHRVMTAARADHGVGVQEAGPMVTSSTFHEPRLKAPLLPML